MVETIFGDTLLKSVLDAITFDAGSLWPAINHLYVTIMLPVGYSLLCLYFLIEVMDKVTYGNLNIEQFFRFFVKFLAGKLFVDNVLNIISGILSFGNSLATRIVESDPGGHSIVNMPKLLESVDNLGFFEQFYCFTQFLVPWLAALVAIAIANVISWTRTSEILIRAMLAPIAMPDLFSDGLRSNGFRYLRKFAAVCLQGAAILIIVIAMQLITQYMISSDGTVIESISDIPFGKMTMTLTCNWVTITLMQKSKDFAMDVVGA